MKDGSVRIRIFLLAATGVMLVVGFHRLLFAHAPQTFSDPKEDMSFAWYVPLFSLYVVWSERSKIAAAVGGPSVIGFLSSLPFLFLGFLGTRGVQVRLEILAFAGLLLTLPWAFFGRGVASRLLFPAGFLLFCIPIKHKIDNL